MKSIVLVGAGNAHLVFLRRWRMDPIPEVTVTLINESSVVPYSGALPGYLAGEYSRAEIELDLVRLCATHGARFLPAKVSALANPLVIPKRPALDYDVLSVNVGSVAKMPGRIADYAIPIRPLSRLLDRLDALVAERIVVVGGGASGVELAIALRRKLKTSVTLVHAGTRLVPNQAAGVGRTFQRVLAKHGIAVRLSTRVIDASATELTLEGGERLPYDAFLWAADPAPHPFAMPVRDTLQSLADPKIFAAGDCATLEGYPDLPHNGVYSVREGRPLYDNIRAFLEGRPLKPYRPQRRALSLLNSGDGRAVLGYGRFVAHTRWAKKFKRRIDRQWLDSFGAKMDSTEPMRCGGCGSKIPSATLAAALDRLEIPDHPNVLIGARDREDAAVIQPPPGMLEIQTVDFFKTFLDDPFRFGKIAAVHAASDIYAMNGIPLSALATVTLPNAAVLHELLAGALEAFKEMGIILTGGHTSEGMELALGFTITGYAKALFRKNALRSGDALVLTKPVGSGAILAAHMRGECPAPLLERLLVSLEQSNAEAARIAAESGVVACTDVTGFGLAGHLLEMLEASRVRADLGAIPRYDGFDGFAERGILSTLHPENAKFSSRIGKDEPALFDPQTSGGLLFGIAPSKSSEVLRHLHEVGYERAAIIGTVK